MSITNDDIKALQNEATQAGDDAMADICRKALQGDSDARTECERVIDNARAQED